MYSNIFVMTALKTVGGFLKKRSERVPNAALSVRKHRSAITAGMFSLSEGLLNVMCSCPCLYSVCSGSMTPS